jgi:hypothetical protein
MPHGDGRRQFAVAVFAKPVLDDLAHVGPRWRIAPHSRLRGTEAACFLGTLQTGNATGCKSHPSISR